MPIPYSVVKRKSSVYTRFELLDVLILLSGELGRTNLNNNFNVRFTNLDMSIHLSYNPKNKLWKLIEDNTTFTSLADLVETLFAKFHGKDELVLGAVMSAANQDKQEVNRLLCAWEKYKEIIRIHTATAEKANCTDSNGKLWVNVATHLGEAEKVVELVDLMWFWKKNPIILGVHGTLSTVGLAAAIACLVTGILPLGLFLLGASLIDLTAIPYILDAADDARVVHALRHQIFYESLDIKPENLSSVATILKKSGITTDLETMKKASELIKKIKEEITVTDKPKKISLLHSAHEEILAGPSSKISLRRG